MVDAATRDQGPASKYLSADKAHEYAAMCWGIGRHDNPSEPFYRGVAELASCCRVLLEAAGHVDRPILELGFGAGRLLYELARLFPASAIHGIEHSPSMLAVAEARLRQHLPVNDLDRVCLESGDVERIPRADATYALVACINVLDRIASPETALRELVRVLGPGGVLLLVHAFDYGQETPQAARLDDEALRGLMGDLGMHLVRRREMVLEKEIGGHRRRFEEVGYIFERPAV